MTPNEVSLKEMMETIEGTVLEEVRHATLLVLVHKVALELSHIVLLVSLKETQEIQEIQEM